ncbi:MAG TPA: ribonuclease H-like domain-containing protein [Planctomycetaceae bacterium]|nr:ribonuclease H-like domain-containing protein [Planctomycetaceae bacterium]
MTSGGEVAYLVFDVEAVGDGDLISRVKYGGRNLTPADAISQYRAELIEQTGKDVLPPTWVLPVAVAIAKVAPDFRLLDVLTLDPPAYRPWEITRRFWQGWQHYRQPTLVTFNGRGYDLPVLELAAFRYGLSVPAWFNTEAKSFEQARYRYNCFAHIDLMDLVSNFGACRVSGGLNLLANLIGKPGKTGIDGSQIQDMHDRGELAAINDYCRCDVLDTYFVFLRSRVLLGKLSLDEEQQIVTDARNWLEEQASDSEAFSHYLKHWGEWQPPG